MYIVVVVVKGIAFKKPPRFTDPQIRKTANAYRNHKGRMATLISGQLDVHAGA